MCIKKIIASVLILLLLVFSSNNFSYEIYSSGGAAVRASQSTGNSHVQALSFSKRTIKKDHQRVRYMGGENACIVPCIVFVPKPLEHTGQKERIFSSSFITDTCPVSFKLRGPPALIAFG